MTEVGLDRLDDLWVRGGFPDSFLARSDAASMRWRGDFIRTYLERDIPELGPRIPAVTLERLWTMLAHNQGGVLNAAQLARNLEVTGATIGRYIDLLVDLLLVRRLPPRIANVGKRLVRSPKVYVRDSGLVHALLGIPDKEALLGHPVVGASWEGMAIEIKRSLTPKPTRGMRSALDDLQPERSFVVYAGEERYRITEEVEAIGLEELCAEL